MSDPAHGGTVRALVFGTDDADEIDGIIDRFCAERLGAGIERVLGRWTSVGVVTAARLSDGRHVAVKVHQPRERPARLEAVHALQSRLHRAGFPCPEPLLGPVALGRGHATVEALLDEGEPRDTHDPACRRLIAMALARHLEILGAVDPPDALAGDWTLYATGGLWPEQAHAPDFDLAATAEGAEWIDRLALDARREITPDRPPVAGHCDWSGKHFRFAAGGDAITAVYDWDSLSLRPEAAIIGIAAMTFTTRFDLPGVARAPSPQELAAFVDEYAAVSSAPPDDDERRQIAAWGLLLAAYTARCEHCGVDGYDGDADPDSFTAALRAHGGDYLCS